MDEALSENQGDAGQIIEETDLLEAPVKDAPSLGRLPKGTVLTLKGEQKNGYFSVNVELMEGSIDGWVVEKTLERSSRMGEVVKGSEGSEKEPLARELEPDESVQKLKPKDKLVVPKDEGLLLRRDKSFLYGLRFGANFNIIDINIDDYYYWGWGFSGGGVLGFYLDRDIPLHLEVNYTFVQGAAPENGVGLQFGFVDVALIVHYSIERFELFGGAQYSFGISLGDIPRELVIGTAFELSSLFVLGGVGYRFYLNDLMTFCLRARYSFGFLLEPVAIQYIGIAASLEFGG